MDKIVITPKLQEGDITQRDTVAVEAKGWKQAIWGIHCTKTIGKRFTPRPPGFSGAFTRAFFGPTH